MLLDVNKEEVKYITSCSLLPSLVATAIAFGFAWVFDLDLTCSRGDSG